MDWKLEVVVVPVTDIDRAKSFYVDKLGFHLDADTQPTETMRVVHMTPPGSACSVVIGPTRVPEGTDMGSSASMQLVVTDIEAARAELVGRGVQVSEIRHMEPGGWVPGPDPKRTDFNSFADFSDPDGNTWVLQERGHSERDA